MVRRAAPRDHRERLLLARSRVPDARGDQSCARGPGGHPHHRGHLAPSAVGSPGLMTVKVPTRVFKQWLEISADSDKVELDLLLTSRLDPVAATALLSQSVERVLKQFEDAHPFNDPPIGDEPPFAGQWDVAPVAEGALLVGGYKSDAFEEIVGLIADELARQGVRGKLDLYARPEVPVEPRGIGTIEAHVRVLGRRVVNGRDRWAAERAALDRVIEVATRWCLQARPERGMALYGTAVPHLPLRRCDRPLDRLRQVIRDDNSVTLAS